MARRDFTTLASPNIYTIRKAYVRIRMGLVMAAVSVLCMPPAWSAGWDRNLNLTSLAALDVGGEVVQVTVAEPVDNSGHCTNSTGYAVRDPAVIKDMLALLTSALITQAPVDLLVSGTCDASGMPSVTGVILRIAPGQ
jgi:hypothetical protein